MKTRGKSIIESIILELKNHGITLKYSRPKEIKPEDITIVYTEPDPFQFINKDFFPDVLGVPFEKVKFNTGKDK